MKNSKFSPKIILYSIITTYLIISLIAGLVIAEKNTKSVGFPNSEPMFVFKNNNDEHFIKLMFLGNSYQIDFSNIHYYIDEVSSYVYNYFM